MSFGSWSRASLGRMPAADCHDATRIDNRKAERSLALWVRHEVVADRPELLPLPWAHGSGAAACPQLARERAQDRPLALAEPARALPLIDAAQHVLGVLAALLLLLGREIAVGQGDGVALRARPPCRSRRRQPDEALLGGDASQRQEVGVLHRPDMGEGGSVAKERRCACRISLNGYPFHTPCSAGLPNGLQSGQTSPSGCWKCWDFLLAAQGRPWLRGVKGIPIFP